MKRLLDQVREFHAAFDVPIVSAPALPPKDRRELRMDLLTEEFDEYLLGEATHDLTEIADALGDMAYIIAGTALEYGIPLDRVIDAIHRANMAKLGPDGKPIKRADGKVIKPEGWQPPDIAGAFNEPCCYPEECARLGRCIRTSDHDKPAPCRGNAYGTIEEATA